MLLAEPWKLRGTGAASGMSGCLFTTESPELLLAFIRLIN